MLEVTETDGSTVELYTAEQVLLLAAASTVSPADYMCDPSVMIQPLYDKDRQPGWFYSIRLMFDNDEQVSIECDATTWRTALKTAISKNDAEAPVSA